MALGRSSFFIIILTVVITSISPLKANDDPVGLGVGTRTCSNFIIETVEIGDDGDADRAQVWEAPDYSRIDLHAYYDLPGSFSAGSTDITIQAFFHIFNLLDAIYVQDAFDDSRYNGYHDDGRHDASSAEVFLGTPRYFNAGLTFRF